MTQSPDRLPLQTRLAAYRRHAEDAMRHAARIYDPSIRASYLSLAASWQKLAEEIERSLRHFERLSENA